MAWNLITSLYGITCIAIIVTYAFPIDDVNEAAQYLQKYGYVGELRPGDAAGNEAISSAIKDFQKFAGLAETGQLDSETVAMMNLPRCGLKDKITPSENSRKKRYAVQGSKWQTNNLSYNVRNYPVRISQTARVDHEIKRAFKVWSDVTPLSFRKGSGTENIDIRFVTRNHGDGSPFDGPGKTLAHAFYPQVGDAHFDDEETWTIDQNSGTNVLWVATHEFGHSLGLGHSTEKKAVMAPFYTGFVPGFKLHNDDIQGIQQIYGRSPDTPPNLCQDASIDAITRTQDGSTYVFKGNFYWKVLSNGLDSGYPRRISDDWYGLEGNLDAAFTSDGKTYFFKGGYYWSSTNKQMDGGYPKLISEGFQGIPNMLDAVVAWGGNGKPYFFKGNEYWRYDKDSSPRVQDMYPLNINEWKGLPLEGIDAAVLWDNNVSYFFKGDQYYRFNDAASKVDDGYPQSTARLWFNCQN